METEQQPPEQQPQPQQQQQQQQQQEQQAAGAGEEQQPQASTAAGGAEGQTQQAGAGDQDVEMAGPSAPEGAAAQPQEQGAAAAAPSQASEGAAAAQAAQTATAPGSAVGGTTASGAAEGAAAPGSSGGSGAAAGAPALAAPPPTQPFDFSAELAEFRHGPTNVGGKDQGLCDTCPHTHTHTHTHTHAALSAAVDSTLAHTEPLGSVCVPCLPASQREAYVKQVSSMAGIVSLASAVARNATQMLPLIATGASPVLARVGCVERSLLLQAAVADAWAGAREVAEKTAAIALEKERVRKGPQQQPGGAAPAAGLSAGHGPGQEPHHAGPAAAALVVSAGTAGGGAEVAMDEEGQVEDMVDESGAARDEDGGDVMTDNVQVARVPGSHATTSGGGANPGTGAGGAAEGSNANTSVKLNGRKKTPEELSADIIHHTTIIIRSLYVSVAKSIHTPARRRDDTSGQAPSMGMRAAALGLATIAKGSLDAPLPRDVPRAAVEAGANAGVQTAIQSAASASAATSTASGGASAPATSDGAGTDGGGAGGIGSGGAGTSAGEGGSSGEAGRSGPEAMAVEGPGPSATAAPLAAQGEPAPADKKEPEQQPACVHGIVQRVVAAHGSLPLLQASGHLSRIADSAYMVLFDVRRRSCHALVLNYFVALGGLPSLAARFGQSADAVWAAMDATAAREEQAAAAKAPKAGGSGEGGSGAGGEEGAAGAPGQPSGTGGGDVVMAEGDAAAPATAAAAAAAGAQETPLAQASKRDPRMLAEKAMQSFLSAYELMSNATLVFSSSQAATFLPLPLPGAAGPAAVSQIKDPAALVRAIQTSAVSAVSAVWRHEKLPSAPPAIMSQVVSVLNNCAEGTATAAAVLLRQRAGGVGLGRPLGFQPDPALVQVCGGAWERRAGMTDFRVKGCGVTASRWCEHGRVCSGAEDKKAKDSPSFWGFQLPKPRYLCPSILKNKVQT
ncbi:hypothetical protein DUNSADRAFT_14409 [Dunaliella salina]|uniref:Uncharacterized protein n=1 Tax=Dunaliella salina TaxID=3046 RepID=A0ABQ7H9G0_DUNSA|nr:hypothetical protein DUNSADRAFT_14409 [Dunaliella salina]|eukprot:KAF5843493.1 hypothetical protein DUNSADRAFT_14409 [Dunaliella salina]